MEPELGATRAHTQGRETELTAARAVGEQLPPGAGLRATWPSPEGHVHSTTGCHRVQVGEACERGEHGSACEWAGTTAQRHVTGEHLCDPQPAFPGQRGLGPALPRGGGGAQQPSHRASANSPSPMMPKVSPRILAAPEATSRICSTLCTRVPSRSAWCSQVVLRYRLRMWHMVESAVSSTDAAGTLQTAMPGNTDARARSPTPVLVLPPRRAAETSPRRPACGSSK